MKAARRTANVMLEAATPARSLKQALPGHHADDGRGSSATDGTSAPGPWLRMSRAASRMRPGRSLVTAGGARTRSFLEVLMLERLGVWAVLAVAFFGMVCLTMNAVATAVVEFLPR